VGEGVSRRSRLKTKRWNDPREAADGFRVLICRFRPRGLRKGDETWDDWWKELAPSAPLLAAYHGKDAPPISWEEYTRRYLLEMRRQTWRIEGLARKVADGDTVTLLCSSACTDPARCHRTLLRDLVLAPSSASSRRRSRCTTRSISDR
jgi:uncharacterized protein YeaO (DUF488 family)